MILMMIVVLYIIIASTTAPSTPNAGWTSATTPRGSRKKQGIDHVSGEYPSQLPVRPPPSATLHTLDQLHAPSAYRASFDSWRMITFSNHHHIPLAVRTHVRELMYGRVSQPGWLSVPKVRALGSPIIIWPLPDELLLLERLVSSPEVTTLP